MQQKKNNQDITNSIAEIVGVTKAQAAKFLQSLTDTIVKGLKNDGKVEIDGMGTLATVKMAGRESVNVANGERIVIGAFTKFTFAPAFKSLFTDKLDDQENGNQEAEDDIPEATGNDDEQDELPQEDTDDNDVVEDENEVLEEYAEDDVPPVKEKPADAFSGIDVLISTPESLEDARMRLNEAKKKEEDLAEKMNIAQLALVQAQKDFDDVKSQLEAAHDEVRTMENNVDNVEKNRKTVIDNENEDNYRPATEGNGMSGNHLMDNKKKHCATGDHNNNGNEEDHDGKKRRIWIMVCAAAACAVIALLGLLFCGKQQPEGGQQRPETESSLKSDKNDNKSVKNQIQLDRQADNGGNDAEGLTEKAQAIGGVANQLTDNKDNMSQPKTENNLKGKNLVRVDTVLFDGKDLLENIVTKHYGEHDMVYRVIQFNRKNGQLNDLKHIPAGTKILLPHYE